MPSISPRSVSGITFSYDAGSVEVAPVKRGGVAASMRSLLDLYLSSKDSSEYMPHCFKSSSSTIGTISWSLSDVNGMISSMSSARSG